MLRKCHYCDPVTKRGEKTVKSIDTDKDDFVKDEKNKYFHLECYKKHLKNKKMSDENINEIINELLEKQKLEIQEANEKDEFLQYIMNFYDGSLPSYFLMKLQKIRKGEYEGINESIDYVTLLDIYKHMESYLRKIAIKKQIKNTQQQMNYDLAIIVGNYGDYKKYKEKQRQNVEDTNNIEKLIKSKENSKKVISRKQTKNENEEFNLLDVIDDILL